MAAAPRSIVRPLLAVVVPLAIVGAASALGPVAPGAAARDAASTPRVYLPLVGHFTRDQLPAPVVAPAGPSPTARASADAPTATAIGPGVTPSTAAPTPRPSATRPSGSAGGEWENFTLSRNVTALAFDAAKGRMWAGTTSGLVAWDVASRVSEKVTVADGLLSNGVTAVAVDPRGRVWVGHEQGVSVSEDGRTWRALRDEDAVFDLEVDAIVGDADGGTWFGTTTGLVERTADGSFERVETPEEVASTPILCALRDGSGNLWFGTDSSGLAKREPDGRWRVFTTADGLPGDNVYSLALDGAGRVWAGTGAGLGRLEPSGGWTVMNTVRGEGGTGPIGRVDAVAVAASGDAWLTANNAVLHVPSGAREAVYNSLTSPSAANEIAATPDGAVWFGLEFTLARRLVSGQWDYWLTPDALPAAGVQAIAVGADGEAWFGTASGVAQRRADGAWRSYTSSLDAAQFIDMASAADGHVWIAAGGGLIEVDRSGEQRLHHLDAALPFDYVAAVSIDPTGRPWIGVGPNLSLGPNDPNVAWRDAAGRWQSLVLRSPLTGARLLYVPVIAFDRDGATWFGSIAGLLRRAADGTLTGFSTRTGMTSDIVNCIEVDAAGRVWVGTIAIFNRDTGRYEGGGVDVYDHGAWTRYTTADGLLSNEDVYAIAFDAKGGTWIATGEGLSYRDGAGKWTSHTAADGLPSGAVLDVAVAPDGAVYAVVVDPSAAPDGFSRIARRAAGGGWQVVPMGVGPADGEKFRSVSVDAAGGLVFGGVNHVVWQAPDGSRRGAFIGVHLDQVQAAAVDAAGNAYFGGPRGLVRRSPAGTWRMWSGTEGLPPGDIRAIEVDSAGRVWLGLSQPDSGSGEMPIAGGVARLDPDGSWRRWGRKDGVASDRVNDLALGAAGALWVAAEPETQADGGTIGGGVSRLGADGAWTTFDEADGLADDWAASIVADGNGVVWVGGSDGVSRRGADGAWTLLGAADGLPDGLIAALALGRDGDLWVGASDGAGRLRPDGSAETFGTADGLGEANVLSIAVGDDAVWFGHLFHGLSRMTLP